MLDGHHTHPAQTLLLAHDMVAKRVPAVPVDTSHTLRPTTADHAVTVTLLKQGEPLVRQQR